MTAIDSGSDIRSGSYSGFEDLVVTLADGVLSVTLNRPDSLNSLTARMLTTFATTLERASDDPRVRVVRVSGAGRGFSSGHTLSARARPLSISFPSAQVREFHRLLTSARPRTACRSHTRRRPGPQGRTGPPAATSVYTPKIVGSASTKTRPQKKWVSTGASTPPVARRCRGAFCRCGGCGRDG